MPANPKYLTTSAWQKFAKIFSGILGGYLISAMLHMAIALWFPYQKNLLITAIYTMFVVWCALAIVPFLFKNGWKVLGGYIIVILLLAIVIYYGNQHQPFN